MRIDCTCILNLPTESAYVISCMVPSVLKGVNGAGVLASCTYIQRLNVLGGNAPKGFFTLPASNGIPNFEAAFPYQVSALHSNL